MRKTITFIVTKDCQLACKYCYLIGKNNKERMTWDVAKKAVDYILAHEDDFQDEQAGHKGTDHVGNHEGHIGFEIGAEDDRLGGGGKGIRISVRKQNGQQNGNRNRYGDSSDPEPDRIVFKEISQI